MRRQPVSTPWPERLLVLAMAVLVLTAVCGSVAIGLTAAGISPLWLVPALALSSSIIALAIRRTRQAKAPPSADAIEAARLARELALLVDGASTYAIYMLDPQGRITIWNAGAERMKGWREQEVLGRHVAFVYPADEVAAGKPQADLARAERDGRLEDEGWRVRKDGTEFLASVTLTALRDDDGALIGFGKVIRDVTDERAVQAMVDAREDQLRSILATVPDAMVVIDDAGTITSFSAAAETLFGWSETEIVGRDIALLMPEPDRSEHHGYMARYLATGERRIIGTRRRVLGLRRDGTTFPLELSIGEASGGGQRVFTGFIRDLSAREAAEARLREMQSELTHVSRLSAMGTMASTLAHELNQPIAAVANYVEASRDMLANPPDAETLAVLREALGEAAGEAFRAGNIVRRLRAFVARGEVDTSVEPLPALIGEAATLGLAGIAERGVASQTHVAEDAGPVLVDRVQIQQVLVNLMRNAVEAMASQGGGELGIRAARDGDMA
ncbi:PAS domain-containing sensor histidine kinase, partial [Sphingomonas sp.]|uniref:PAS domain-containing sensor histidine kinase n=1 Tax=Sphingomonas sp. TaxID=28214 RepID=UPI003B3AE5A6